MSKDDLLGVIIFLGVVNVIVCIAMLVGLVEVKGSIDELTKVKPLEINISALDDWVK
jgi:hypothetical protein